MINFFKKYTIPSRTFDLSFDGIQVILERPEKTYLNKLVYNISSPLEKYYLYLNGEKVKGEYSCPREGRWAIFSYTDLRELGKEDILRYLDTGEFWPSEDEYKVYRFGDMAEIILKKPPYHRPDPKSIRTVAQLLGPSSGYYQSCFPTPFENYTTYDLYINEENRGYQVSAPKDGCGDIYILPGMVKLTKSHLQKYLETGKLLP